MLVNSNYKGIYPLLFLLFFVLLYFNISEFLNDPDTGWHIMGGYYYLEHGFTKQDPFSFTTNGNEWLNISWIWDVIFAQIHKLGGLYLVALVSIYISIGIILFVFKQASARSNLICAFICLIAALNAFAPIMLARPHLLAVLLILLFYKLTYERKVWLLPILTILLVNIHGSFIMLFTILGAFGLESLLTKNRKEFLRLLFVSLLCFAASFLSSLGADSYIAAYRTLNSGLKDVIIEWQPSNNIFAYLYLIITLPAIWMNRKTLRAADIILYFLWMIAGILSMRYMAIFVLLTMPVGAEALLKLNAFTKKNADFERDLSNQKLYKISGFLCICAIIFSFIRSEQLELSPKLMPTEEVEYILKEHPNSRILNYYDYGGYIIYKAKGKLPVFIDGRAETAYSSNLVNDYITFTEMQLGWDKVLQKHKVDLVIFPVDNKEEHNLLLNGWQKIYEGKIAVIYKTP